MDFLSKVLYCADYIEPTRKFYSHVDFNVLNNLDKLLEFVVKNKLKHIGSSEIPHPNIYKIIGKPKKNDKKVF
ncbi:hypothetical protein KA977_09150, partial [Candidatus Dependentiae bacterium]|nr:hypothetical protein [Candidatus Dependentiae bacterium]